MNYLVWFIALVFASLVFAGEGGAQQVEERTIQWDKMPEDVPGAGLTYKLKRSDNYGAYSTIANGNVGDPGFSADQVERPAGSGTFVDVIRFLDPNAPNNVSITYEVHACMGGLCSEQSNPGYRIVIPGPPQMLMIIQ